MTLNAIQTLAFTAAVVYMGRYLRTKLPFIMKYNLPSPVIAGFLVAAILALLKTNNIFEIAFDKAAEQGLMIAFFASIGYSASFRLLKEGGRAVVLFLFLSVVGLVLQIGAGVGAALAMDLPPLMGVLTGTVALVGGPGTALAFGPAFEAAGIKGASVIGLTSAMGGILLGGLVGTPLATYLIQKRKLTYPKSKDLPAAEQVTLLKSYPNRDLLLHILALTLIMGLGTALSSWINDLGITLPIYIGSMIIAAIVRNIEDVRPTFKISSEWIEEIGQVALTLFIAMAIMSLRLEELKNAALPILIFLSLQTVLVALIAIGPSFWYSGKDYDSAVTSAGYVGFMMGTTANAMANMSALVDRYGAAPRAFLVVPLVGACFIDFINAALITLCLNYL